MKKNLRIVSAAAAALLAVAPIAAVAGANPAIVSAAANTQLNFGGSSASAVKTDVTLNPTITAISGNSEHHIAGSISGTISATYNGQSYQANLPTSTDNAKIYRQDTYSTSASTVKPADLRAGYTYRVEIANPSFNFGSANANKTLHIAVPKNVYVTYGTGSAAHEYHGQTITVTTKQNGVVNFAKMSIRDVKPLDLTNTNAVNFYEKATGNQVQSGSVSVNALNGGRLNVSAVVAAITDKYVAAQVNGNSNPQNNATLSDVASEVESALKAANVTVDNAGWFTAPSSFVVNVAATSNVNGNKASLAVTVNVPNAKKAATETGVSKTIMHVASIYDKNGKKTSDPEIHAYDTVSVLANPVELKDASGKSLGKFYKVANKDQYIKVGNIDGTSRTLSHNAYLYHRTAAGKFVAKTHRVHKKTRHVVVKKGTQETTYGSALYGKKYYRIGRNQYIKVANFR